MSAPERYLGAIVRLLPDGRRQWGQAMQAELATIDGTPERWRFVLGCTRAAVLPPARPGVVWQPLAMAAGAAAVIAGEIALAGIVGQTIPLLLVLALLAWLGRRPGYLGPVRPDRTARTVRTGAYLVVGAYLVALIAGDGDGFLQPNRANWGPVFTVMLTLFTVVFLALTARSSRLGSTALAAGVSSGLVAGVAAFAAIPFQESDTSLADGLPGDGGWLLIVAFAAPAVAALVTRARRGGDDQQARAALCAGTIATLVVALLGFAAVVLFPRSLDAVRAIMLPGTSHADLRAEQDIGASDTYAGVLMLGTMLAAVLWVALRPLRGRASFGLLALLSAPPALFGVALAGSAPKAAAVTFAAAALTLAAAATIAASAPPRSEATGSS
jgi:hypothetical protein